MKGSAKKRQRISTSYKKPYGKQPRQLKWIDHAHTSTDFENGTLPGFEPAAHALELTNMPIGNSSQQRKGNFITAKKIVWTLDVQQYIDTSPFDAKYGYRLLLVVNKMAKGSTPVVTDILKDSVTTQKSTTWLRNLDTASQYTVLLDKIWPDADKTSVHSHGGAAHSERHYFHRGVVNLNMEVGYSGATTPAFKNAIWFILLSDMPDAKGFTEVEWTARLRFEDDE